jgi:ferric-dicitrate binding protein FerR (iron transport regulator)
MSEEMIVKYLLNECDAACRAEVEHWIQSSPEHAAVYHQYKKVWEQSKLLQHIPPKDTEASWQKLKGKMQPAPSLWVSTVRKYSWVAAVLVIGLIGVWIWMRPSKMQEPEVVSTMPKKDTSTIQHIVKNTVRGKTDTLADRSVVTLNQHAELSYPEKFAEAERRVALKGEAFFNITPDRTKPFFVDAGNDVEIRVVGTSFNVKAMEGYTEVIVETGIVEVKKFRRVVLLHPGEKARIDRDDSSIVVQKHRDKLYRYYRDKHFECDNTPLWKVVEVLNEAYGDSVRIDNKALRTLTITTRFDEQELENILDIIAETFEIKVEKEGGIYHLK